jgi:hypothetical protein
MKKIMKKRYALISISAWLLMLAATTLTFPLSAQDNTASMQIDGNWLSIPSGDQRAVMLTTDLALMPLRAVTQEFGFTVEWDEVERIVILSSEQHRITVQIGSYTMVVNGADVPLDTPPLIMGDRTMVSTQTISDITGMDVHWTWTVNIIHILTPFPAIYDWPEHLPEHIPGSVVLVPTLADLRHWTLPPMRFRHAFYNIPFGIMSLVDSSERWEWLGRFELYYTENDINILMRFVKYFDISREDFDAVIEFYRKSRVQRGWDMSEEGNELPNADIIFTFDNDLIRWFYRRE